MTTERAPLELGPTEIAALTAQLDAPYQELARDVRKQLAADAVLLDLQISRSDEDFREEVLKQLLVLTQNGHTGLGYPTEYGGGGDVGASITAFQNLAYGDLSLLVKAGVQFGLFGGAIVHLGTQRHHEMYLADVIAGRVLGCFAMSETGHGSNVQSVETTATFDPGDR